MCDIRSASVFEASPGKVRTVRAGAYVVAGMCEGESLCFQGVVEVRAEKGSRGAVVVQGHRLAEGRFYHINSHAWSSALRLEATGPGGVAMVGTASGTDNTGESQGNGGGMGGTGHGRGRGRGKGKGIGKVTGGAQAATAADDMGAVVAALLADYPIVVTLRSIRGACAVEG